MKIETRVTLTKRTARLFVWLNNVRHIFTTAYIDSLISADSFTVDRIDGERYKVAVCLALGVEIIPPAAKVAPQVETASKAERRAFNWHELRTDFANHKRQHIDSYKDRQGLAEDRQIWLDGLNDAQNGHELISERVHWLLIGTYGLGVELLAHFIIGDAMLQPHIKAERLLRLVAAVEWRIYYGSFLRTWYKADKTKREALRDKIEGVIAYYENEYLPTCQGELYTPSNALPLDKVGHWPEFNIINI